MHYYTSYCCGGMFDCLETHATRSKEEHSCQTNAMSDECIASSNSGSDRITGASMVVNRVVGARVGDKDVVWLLIVI